MNAVTGIDNLILLPGKLQCPYWAAYWDRLGDKNKFRDNYHVNDNTIEQAESQLRDLVEDLKGSGCNLIIWFSQGPKPNKGGYHVKFFQPQGLQAQVSGISSNPVDTQGAINEALEKFKKELLIEQLNKEVTELKKQIRELQPTATDRVMQRMSPVFEPQVIGAIVKKVFDIDFDMNTINNAAHMGSTVDQEQAQKIAEDSLNILSEGEEDFYLTLQKLAELKKNDPEKYKFAKSML